MAREQTGLTQILQSHEGFYEHPTLGPIEVKKIPGIGTLDNPMKFGPLKVSYIVGIGNIVFTGHPDLIQELDNAADKIELPYKGHLIEILSGSTQIPSLLSFPGSKVEEEFQKMRSEILTAVAGKANLKERHLVSLINAEIDELLGDDQNAITFNSQDLAPRIAASVIGTVLLGKGLSGEDIVRLDHVIDLLQNYFAKGLFPGVRMLFSSDAKEIMDARDELLRPLLEYMVENKEGGAYMLLEKLAEEKGIPVQDLDPMDPFVGLIRSIFTSLQAGYHTSFSFTSSMLVEMAKDEDRFLKLQEELSNFEQNPENKGLSEEKLLQKIMNGKMPALELFISECLIKNPPANMLLRKYKIPKASANPLVNGLRQIIPGGKDNTVLVMFKMSDIQDHIADMMARRGIVAGTTEEIEFLNEVSKYVFAKGLDRFCLGMSLALREARLSLYCILKRFARLNVAEGTEEEVRDPITFRRQATIEATPLLIES